MSKIGPTKQCGALIETFPTWVSYFETNTPFRKYGLLEYHRETLARR